MSLSSGLYNVFQDSVQTEHFWQKYDRRDVGFFSLSPIRWCLVLICSITDIHFDHLFKMVSAGLLHCKITLFPFVINNYVGRYFETM